jgi:hypothetical protein
MKRRPLSAKAAALGVPALALGLGLGLSATASASPASASPASASPAAAGAAAAGAARVAPARTVSQVSASTVVINCLGTAQVRPGSIILACADGNNYLSGLSWTSWTPNLASATGTQVANDCIPYCAAGHFHSFPVLVVLWGSAQVGGHPGMHRYTEITLVYPGARPEVYNGHRWVEGPVTVTMSLFAPPG